VQSGAGGDGCVSFLRAKFAPRGGPDGGDGGHGGGVILVADPQITTLLDIGRARLFRAESGKPGRGRSQTGRSGEDLRIPLPVGTVVRSHPDGALIVDLDRPGQEHLIAHGGRGGRGNERFANSIRQAPRESEPGGEAETRELALELKLVADIGLLGLPNAGKSTFLARVSAAHPKIADYPFTTLAPQLGIVELSGERRMVVADIPGIIEGAHRGVGLGLDFLRHLERTRVLLHLMDPYGRDPAELARDHRVIREELARHSELFASRPKVTALNKGDRVPPGDRAAIAAALEREIGEPVAWISGVSGEGIPVLLERLWGLLG
jgi:GTP-binding protein